MSWTLWEQNAFSRRWWAAFLAALIFMVGVVIGAIAMLKIGGR